LPEQSVIIVGAGGHGSELCAYLRSVVWAGDAVQVAGFVDDNKSVGPFLGTELLGGFDGLKEFLADRGKSTFFYITAVGDNKIRMDLVRRIKALDARNLRPYTLRYPGVFVGDLVEIGEGTCLAPGSIVTTRSKIGRHCILNIKTSVSHDCIIGDFVNLNPGVTICGNARIGEGGYIGAGATIIDGVSVGEWSIIGAGAVVVEGIPPHVTAVGAPARVIKRHAL